MQRNDSKPVSVPKTVVKPGYVPFAKDTSIDQKIRDKVISGEGVKVHKMRIWAMELLALKNEDIAGKKISKRQISCNRDI